MSVIQVEGLAEHQPKGPLDKGWYSLAIVDRKMISDERLLVSVMVTDGPTQQDESDPTGRKFGIFFTVAGFESHSDGGEFAKDLLAKFLDAIEVDRSSGGFELDDLLEKKFTGYVTTKADLNGIPRENVTEFHPIEDE